MPRPFKFPDPKDRTINSPTYLVSPSHLLGLYNQMAPDGKKSQIITDEIKTWFEKESRQHGWNGVAFSGNQCTLSAHLTLKYGDTTLGVF